MRWPPASLVPHYLVLQAVTIALWWLVMWLVPAARVPFVVAGLPDRTLFAFVIPDVVLLVVGSLFAAIAVRAQDERARPLLWLLLGAVGYATLWCIGTNVASGAGFWSTAVMTPACLAMGWTVAVGEPRR
jgi:hypothetical protein